MREHFAGKLSFETVLLEENLGCPESIPLSSAAEVGDDSGRAIRGSYALRLLVFGFQDAWSDCR